jgi:hypothetical protein
VDTFFEKVTIALGEVDGDEHVHGPIPESLQSGLLPVHGKSV